jgi:uncharacterized RDD family membrane protein YckC
MERYPTPNLGDFAGILDRRLEALLIDGILVALFMAVLGFVAGMVLTGGDSIGGVGGAILAAQFGFPVGLFAYQIGLEGYYGQTVGKSLRGIVVVMEDGSPCTWVASVVRNLLRIVDVLPVLYLVGIVASYVDDENQRIGDMLASTVVVSTQN